MYYMVDGKKHYIDGKKFKIQKKRHSNITVFFYKYRLNKEQEMCMTLMSRLLMEKIEYSIMMKLKYKKKLMYLMK